MYFCGWISFFFFFGHFKWRVCSLSQRNFNFYLERIEFIYEKVLIMEYLAEYLEFICHLDITKREGCK